MESRTEIQFLCSAHLPHDALRPSCSVPSAFVTTVRSRCKTHPYGRGEAILIEVPPSMCDGISCPQALRGSSINQPMFRQFAPGSSRSQPGHWAGTIVLTW